MVADRIVVTSRRAGADEVWTWTSSGGSGFEIAPGSEEDAKRIARGTEIVLHLKPDAKKYLETYEIERIVRAYSDNIQFPIRTGAGRRRAEPDQFGERAVAAVEVGIEAGRLRHGLQARSRTPSTSRR